MITYQDIFDQVFAATEASEGTYDVAAIADEFVQRYGLVGIDATDPDAFWTLVMRHAFELERPLGTPGPVQITRGGRFIGAVNTATGGGWTGHHVGDSELIDPLPTEADAIRAVIAGYEANRASILIAQESQDRLRAHLRGETERPVKPLFGDQ